MSDHVLELATITLAPGSSEADLLAASANFQSAFLDAQEGFLRRDMIRKSADTFLDVILWQSRAHADAVFAKAQTSEAAGAYFQHMAFDPNAPHGGVEHHAVVASFVPQA